MSPTLFRTWLVIAIGALSGCATNYVGRSGKARASFESGDYRAAAAGYRALYQPGSIDELLALLDEGTALQAAGDYARSIEVLTRADELAAKLDVVSVSEEAGSLLTSEATRAYRGEDFERLLIAVLQALNYAMLGKNDDALVEVRRCNERLEKMVAKDKKPYEQLAIARYLGGVLYERAGDYDNAVIDYLKAVESTPHPGPAVVEPALRLARLTGRSDAEKELREKYPAVTEVRRGPTLGQLVVVVAVGTAPQKRGSTRAPIGPGGVLGATLLPVPVYPNRGVVVPQAVVEVDGVSGNADVVTSIDEVAKLHLDDRIGRLLAKSFASLAVKAGLAAGIGALTKSKEVGAFAFFLLASTSQADTRSWLTLPSEFQAWRASLPAGQHRVAVDFAGRHSEFDVEVKGGAVAVVSVRMP